MKHHTPETFLFEFYQKNENSFLILQICKSKYESNKGVPEQAGGKEKVDRNKKEKYIQFLRQHYLLQVRGYNLSPLSRIRGTPLFFHCCKDRDFYLK